MILYTLTVSTISISYMKISVTDTLTNVKGLCLTTHKINELYWFNISNKTKNHTFEVVQIVRLRRRYTKSINFIGLIIYTHEDFLIVTTLKTLMIYYYKIYI